MPVSLDLQERLEKIDRQLADLLVERMGVFQDAVEEDEEALSAENLASVLEQWDELADELGWSPALAQRACRALNDLCKAGEE